MYTIFENNIFMNTLIMQLSLILNWLISAQNRVILHVLLLIMLIVLAADCCLCHLIASNHPLSCIHHLPHTFNDSWTTVNHASMQKLMRRSCVCLCVQRIKNHKCICLYYNNYHHMLIQPKWPLIFMRAVNTIQWNLSMLCSQHTLSITSLRRFSCMMHVYIWANWVLHCALWLNVEWPCLSISLPLWAR